MELKELSPAEFNDFVSIETTNNFLQSSYAFSRYKNKNQEAYLLGLVKNQKILAAALVVKIRELKGKKVFSAPGGPILNYELKTFPETFKFFVKELKVFLKNKSGSVLQISPNIKYEKTLAETLKSNHFKELGEYIQCKWISTLDLSKFSSESELLSSFRKGHRYSVKYSSSRYHLEIRELKFDELKILKDLSNKSAKKHAFSDQPLTYYEEMFTAFKDKIKVLAAFYENTPISAAMFIIYGNEIVYLYSGSDPEYNKYCGPFALQWEMMTYALKNKIPRYNFYGVKPFDGDGVYEFKRGFRAETEELAGTFMLPLDAFGKIYTLKHKYHKYSEVA